MNILFITGNEVSPEQGGTERITSSLANSLSALPGYHCFSAYRLSVCHNCHKTKFEAYLHFTSSDTSTIASELIDFINIHDIDIIINQNGIEWYKIWRELSTRCPHVSLVYAHHFAPGWIDPVTFKRIRRRVGGQIYGLRDLASKTRTVIRCIYERARQKWMLQYQYRKMYENSSKVVLLSRHFIPEYAKFAKINDQRKFYVINNMLSFDEFFDMSTYKSKKNQVLIVSRLSEVQKRISLAIRIWSIIEQDKDLQDWELAIVGHGEDEHEYIELAQSLGLRRVAFNGIQNPLPYYGHSSLFMMTSISEGWGLTLTEAQQMGCVPIAFDTYSSLHDIIEDGKNGYIVKEGDISNYVERMKNLMKDAALREKMAKHAIDTSHSFERSYIVKQWEMLFSNLQNERQ